MMPALYQLVPGSMIAKLWFSYIFPPQIEKETVTIPGTSFEIEKVDYNAGAGNVFGGLMIVSTSLALGLIVGFAVVTIWDDFVGLLGRWTQILAGFSST